MHAKWLTYRVSWCNVRVKLGQSLWAGGALAKRLPLLQETDRQWEKTCQSVSQCSDITHLHHQSQPLPWCHTDAASSAGVETKRTLPTFIQSQEVREEVLNYQKICLMMNRMTWHSNYNGWIKREQPHLINPEQLRWIKRKRSKSKQPRV